MGKSTVVAVFVLGASCLQLSRPDKFRYVISYIKYVICCPEHSVLTVC